jgi:hypothetical protein
MDTGGLGASDWRGTARKRQCLHLAPARGGADWHPGAKAAARPSGSGRGSHGPQRKKTQQQREGLKDMRSGEVGVRERKR